MFWKNAVYIDCILISSGGILCSSNTRTDIIEIIVKSIENKEE